MSKFSELRKPALKHLFEHFGDLVTLIMPDKTEFDALVNFDQEVMLDSAGNPQMIHLCSIRRTDLAAYKDGIIIQFEGKRFKTEALDQSYGNDSETLRIAVRKL